MAVELRAFYHWGLSFSEITLGDANLYLINPNGILFGENARLDVNGSFFATSADSVLFENGFEFSAVNPSQPPLLTINIPIGLRFRDNPGDIIVRGKGNGARFFDSEVIDTQEALRVDSNATIGLIGGNLMFEDATIKTAGGRIELGSVAEGKVNLIKVANGFTVDYSEVEAFKDISLSGSSNIDASGLGSGDINVIGKNITLKDISGIEAKTLGGETAGDIQIFASESLEITGIDNDNDFISGIFTRIFPKGTADGGDINIKTGSLRLGDRAVIATTVSGQGNAGDINIDASENISLISQGNTSAIASNVTEGAIGNGGDININTGLLTVSKGAFLNANTSGEGNSGDITINASKAVSLDGQGTGFFTNVRTSKTLGNGGNIDITTSFLTISNQASLNASTSGQGNAGNININAKDSILIEGQEGNSFNTNILTDALNSSGNAGDINLITGSLTLKNGASLLADANNQSSAGNITIKANDKVSLADGSFILIDTGAYGGSLTIDTKSLAITSGSNIQGGINSNSGSTEAQAGDIMINASENITFDGQISGIYTSIAETGVGNTGNIDITTKNFSLTNGGQIFSTIQGKGNIGKVNINVSDSVFLDGLEGNLPSRIAGFVNQSGVGNVGEINLNTKNLVITNGASIGSIVAGTGNTSDLTINASETISFDGEATNSRSQSGIFSAITAAGVGSLGNINLTTSKLSITNGANITHSINGRGNKGDVSILATDSILFDGQGSREGSFSGVYTLSLPDAIGEGDNIQITTNNFSLSNLATVSADNAGEGNAGNITINATNLTLANGASINARTTGKGNAGNITINATDSLSLQGSAFFSQDREIIIPAFISSIVLSEGVGNGGDINIKTRKLSLSNGFQIDSSTRGQGNAGNITIDAVETISLDGKNEFGLINNGILTGVEKDAIGNAGDINLKTANLSLTNGAFVNSSTFGKGNAGNVTILATDTVFVAGHGEINDVFASSDISSSVQPGAVGNGGEVKIDANNLFLTNGAQILSATFRKGNGGNITINVAEDIVLDGESPNGLNSGIGVGVEAGGIGQGGIADIKTKNLFIINGAQIRSSTFGIGDAGDIIINATENISLEGKSRDGFGSSISGSVELDGVGNGGEIEIDAKNLVLTDEAFISSSTGSDGNAGVLTIHASESIQVLGGSDLSSSAVQGNGNSRDINIFTDELMIRDGGIISVGNFSSSGLFSPGTGEPGNLIIEANNISLDNNARIDAATQAGDNGNIILKVTEDIILRDNSLISARALKDGTGGNIDIDARFIVAFPNQNNDIIASATQGDGGKIDITAEALFGIKERPLTPRTNDINASSEAGFPGEINIQQPTIDPVSGLLELTQEVIDPAELIAQNVCTQTADSEFVDIGKGGLPPNPGDILAENSIEVELVEPIMVSGEEITANRERAKVKPRINRKPPAQGWIFHENGIVELVAYNPHQVGEQRIWDNYRSCR